MRCGRARLTWLSGGTAPEASFARNKDGWVPGKDIAGVVLKQAANGAGPSAGTRVVALVDDFGWAERAAVPAHRMAPLPDGVRFAQAATLPVAGLTALRTLRFGGALIAEGSLKPRIGVERSWRDLLAVGEQLRERLVAGKAVLTIDGV